MRRELHLLHTRPDAMQLAAWAVRRHARHERQALDIDDAVHGLLRAVFGPEAPQPFRYLNGELLAYTTLDPRALAEKLAGADPRTRGCLGLSESVAGVGGYSLRRIPSEWPEGMLLGFEVRLRPTVRSARGEQDAFLHAVAQSRGAPVEREAVYCAWLRQHLAVSPDVPREPWQGAVEVLDVEMKAFRRSKVVRRSHAAAGERRRSSVVDGPDAVLKGRLRVTDPTAFEHLLARGVGRHRSFGFGMLLLGRAANS